MNIRKVRWEYPKGSKHYQTAWRLDARSRGNGQMQFKTKREAELWRDKLIRDDHAETFGISPEPGITFKGFVELYGQKKTWKTESYQARMLSALSLVPFAETRLDRIGAEAVIAYREHRLQKSAPATVRQDLAAIKDCFKWAVKLGYLRRNPAGDVERPSLPVKQDDPAVYLSPEQFSDLLAKAGRDRPLYKLVAWTGLRITEVLKLEWTDVEADYLVVRRGKGRKQRLIPLIRQAREALAEAKKVTHLGKPTKVFWWASDRHATLRRFQRRLEWAGIEKRYRFHDLRHTFGAWAASSGVDLRVIAEAMGHTDITVTKTYAHLHPSFRRKELERMEGYGRKAVEQHRKGAKRKGSHPS